LPHWAQTYLVSAGARRRLPIAAHGVWMYGASTPARRSNRRLAAASSPWAQHRRQSSPQQWGYLARLTRYGSLPRLLANEVCDIAGSLIRRQERDDHLSQSAALASKPVPHLRQREIVPEMCALAGVNYFFRTRSRIFVSDDTRAAIN
jgi:hypothetical protein